MINDILSKLGLTDGFSGQLPTRRRHVRHPGTQAEVIIMGRAYSVQDWSLGGFFFETPPDARLIVGDQIEFNLRFRLPHQTVNITQKGRIVRTAKRGVAAEFAPLTAETRRQFERVLDGFHTQSFLESQVA